VCALAMKEKEWRHCHSLLRFRENEERSHVPPVFSSGGLVVAAWLHGNGGTSKALVAAVV